MRRALPILLALAGCASGERHAELARPTPAFSAAQFFSGRTEGTGKLEIIFSKARAFHVDGRGAVTPDGAFVLDQTVEQEGKAPTKREWRISPAVGHAGTLPDAVGPVTMATTGNLLHLSFAMKGGTRAEQWLYLQPDGRTVLNRMAVTKFGLRVATIEETIRKVDG